MANSKLVSFIRQHPDDWERLLKEPPYNLLVQRRGELILFKYVFGESDFSLPEVCEARGIILRDNSFKVVCRPFDKFFNLGQVEAADLNLRYVQILEKIDGSLIKIYFHDGKWRVATNGTVDASHAESEYTRITFDQLFNDIVPPQDFAKLTAHFKRGITYLFELVHPKAQIVVDYGGKHELVFIGMRHNVTGRDCNIFHPDYRYGFEDILVRYNIRYPKVYEVTDLTNLDVLIELADQYNPGGNEFEGFIAAEVIDRVVMGRNKIKSLGYLSLHRLATGQGTSNVIVDALREGRSDDYEGHLHQMHQAIQDHYWDLKRKFEAVVAEITDVIESCRDQIDECHRVQRCDECQELLSRDKCATCRSAQKKFALYILKHVPSKYVNFVFTYANNGYSVREMLGHETKQRVKALIESVKIDETF